VRFLKIDLGKKGLVRFEVAPAAAVKDFPLTVKFQSVFPEPLNPQAAGSSRTFAVK